MKAYLLSRLPVLIFLIAWIVQKVGNMLPGFRKAPSHKNYERSLLVIEAGERGWLSIEFQELYQSGIEFFGNEGVTKLVVNKKKPYVQQVRDKLESEPATHYLYDPRTGSQDFFPALSEAIQLAALFARYRIIPVVLLTDLSLRLWRCKAAAVTATNGVVVTLMMPRIVQPIFPHRRLTGPSLMPFSQQLLRYLDKLREKIHSKNEVSSIVRFTGSLYEPRTSFINQLSKKLEKSGHKMEVLGRELGSERVSDEQYWSRLSSAEIIFTTAAQASRTVNDWGWIPHLVYRYIEVLAVGSLLLAPHVPGIDRFFVRGVHFVAFDTVDEAAELAAYYLDNPAEALRIKEAGRIRAAHLIESHSFWLQIDAALGSSAFILSSGLSDHLSDSTD